MRFQKLPPNLNKLAIQRLHEQWPEVKASLDRSEYANRTKYKSRMHILRLNLIRKIRGEIKRTIPHGEDCHHCEPGCPQYSSGHSISADGSCNKGCC